jgi:hypothetical protein
MLTSPVSFIQRNQRQHLQHGSTVIHNHSEPVSRIRCQQSIPTGQTSSRVQAAASCSS